MTWLYLPSNSERSTSAPASAAAASPHGPSATASSATSSATPSASRCSGPGSPTVLSTTRRSGTTSAPSTGDRGEGDATSSPGGIPCQPFSMAGRRKASADERNLWPDFARVLGEVRPRYAFIENVAGLASVRDSGGGELEGDTGLPVRYLGVILGDLASLGYDAEWACLRASDSGAPHRRERLWILAQARRASDERRRGPGGAPGETGTPPGEAPERERRGDAAGDGLADVADAERHRPQGEHEGGATEAARLGRERGAGGSDPTVGGRG